MKTKFIILLILIFTTKNCFSQDENKLLVNGKSNCFSSLSVDVDNDIILGKLPQGAFKQYQSKYMKFIIHGYGCFKIKTCCYSENYKDGVRLNLNWKMGPCTGNEEPYKNKKVTLNIYGYYYVKMELLSIEISNSAKKGEKNFRQVITVEYTDI